MKKWGGGEGGVCTQTERQAAVNFSEICDEDVIRRAETISSEVFKLGCLDPVGGTGELRTGAQRERHKDTARGERHVPVHVIKTIRSLALIRPIYQQGQGMQQQGP